MSEQLKSYKMVDEDYCDNSLYIVPSDVYLKSEADKLIAELNMRICEGDEDFEIANNQIKRLLKIVRQQKYKRCLNNAWWCLREEFFAEDCRCERWVDWSIKWYKRWIELAEQFKDVK